MEMLISPQQRMGFQRTEVAIVRGGLKKLEHEVAKPDI